MTNNGEMCQHATWIVPLIFPPIEDDALGIHLPKALGSAFRERNMTFAEPFDWNWNNFPVAICGSIILILSDDVQEASGTARCAA
jgi:hypothetical protein